MDRLRNIDQLLKNSLEGQELVTPELSGDWLAIEKRLGQRKNRIYAVWFSLALIVVSSLVWFMVEPAGDPLVANESEILSEQAVVSPEGEAVQDRPIVIESTEELNSTPEAGRPAQQEDIAPAQRVPNATDPPTPVVEEQHESQGMEGMASATTEPAEPVVQATESNEAGGDVSGQEDAGAIAMEETPEQIQDVPAEETEVVDPPLANDPKPTPPSGGSDGGSKPSLGHWEIGVALTPSFTDKIMSTNTLLGGLIHRSFRDIVKTSESADLAYNSSVNMGYHWNNGWFLQSGIGLSQRTERVDYNYVITHTVKVDAKENRIVEYTPRQPNLYKTIAYSGSNSYHFVEVPLQIGYRWKLSKNWEWRNQVGGSYLLLTNSLGKKPDYTYLELTELAEASYLNKHHFSGHVRSGVYYNFKNFVIGAEPIAGMSFNSLNNKNSAIQVQPYYYGFNLTTQFKLYRD